MADKPYNVGITFSTFDLLHVGHIGMLREAASICDRLIVGLQVDPSINRPTKNAPIQSLYERHFQLRAIKYIDEIIPYQTEEDLEDILSVLQIDVRILGEEYRDKDFTGKDICKKRNIQLYFNDRDHRFSSTELRQRIYDMENRKQDDD
jgi:glycerol-3-phosphate cytidylyltransferase